MLDENPSPSDIQESDQSLDSGFVSIDQTARAHLAAMVESSSLQITKSEQSGLVVNDVKDKQQSVIQLLQGSLEREITKPSGENTEASEEVTGQLNGMAFNKWADLPTPSSDSQSLADENGNAVTQKNGKSHFSMACLCGAPNCRKFLFF